MAVSIWQLAADAPAAADPGNGPLVTIIVAALVAVGTIATAMGPALMEMAKARKAAAPPSAGGPSAVAAPPSAATQPPPASSNNPMTPVMAPGIDALSMVDAAVRDYRAQRDTALQRVDQLQANLDSARVTIGQQLVEITQLRGRLARYEPVEYPDHYERQQPMQPRPYPDPYRGDRWSS